jgi:hypothetical protein
VGVPDCVRTVQGKLSGAREYLNRGEGAKALQEINETLEIDPDFLAAQLLRDSILIWFAERGLSPPSPPLTPVAQAGFDGGAKLDKLHSVHNMLGEGDDRWSIPTTTVAAEPFRPWLSAVAVGLLAVIAAALGAVSAAELGWIRRPQVIVVSPPSLMRPTALPSLPLAVSTETVDVPDAPHAPPVALAPATVAASDDRLVRLAVERYQFAMNAHARSHPDDGVGTWTIDTCIVVLDGEAATAKCRGTITTGTGRHEPRVSTFSLRRTSSTWRIIAVMPGDAPRDGGGLS